MSVKIEYFHASRNSQITNQSQRTKFGVMVANQSQIWMDRILPVVANHPKALSYPVPKQRWTRHWSRRGGSSWKGTWNLSKTARRDGGLTIHLLDRGNSIPQFILPQKWCNRNFPTFYGHPCLVSTCHRFQQRKKIKGWTPTSAKYSIMVSYFRDIGASPLSSKAFKVEIPTRTCKLASHSALTSENILAFFFKKQGILNSWISP
jgi:hypothetical protein